MRTISNSTGTDSNSQTRSENFYFAEDFAGDDAYKEIIKKAEALPLIKIFKMYRVNCDSNNRKTICPFLHHKSGRESSASFYYYPETNTFWCFGCKTGVTSVDFIAAYDKINKFKAANKIINLFSKDLDGYVVAENSADSFKEKFELISNFSKKMRTCIEQDPDLLPKIEKIYSIFDKMNDKYDLDNDALKSLISKLEIKLEEIICQSY